ncbi:MAG: hypothetical protein UW42_C0013G0001, partial [Candidatus Collierbacteria bacterium GW2011_GWB1_44_197]
MALEIIDCLRSNVDRKAGFGERLYELRFIEVLLFTGSLGDSNGTKGYH